MKCLKCGSTQITKIQYPTEKRINYYCRTCQETLSLDNVTVSIASPRSTRQEVQLRNRTAQIQQRKLPEQTIQKINKQKLIDRRLFANLSARAMNPNVETCYPLPKLDDRDMHLVEKWHHLSRNSLDRTSLIKTGSRDWELGRLLSARSAEKIAKAFYQRYEKKVKDTSITQIDKNSESEWEKYDLEVGNIPIDVKNSRRSRNSPDRYTKHCVPKFKHSRKGQDVIIAGFFSPYLQVYELLGEPEPYHKYREIQFLGETTQKSLQALKNEFNDLVDFVDLNSESEYFLPPWVFDYPEYVYADRDKALKELKDFTNLDSLKGITPKCDLRPVGIAASIDLTEILGNETLEEWEQHFLNQLRNRIGKFGLSLPFLFLTILNHFLCMAASPKTVSNFEPSKYRRFLFYEESDKPLGIYDPLKTIDALIKALSTLWKAENELIRTFRKCKLKSFNILQGKPDSSESLWTTLIAYCGGRLEDGSACGKNPLVLGKSKHCEYHKVICPACGFCCKRCEEENHTKAEGLENA